MTRTHKEMRRVTMMMTIQETCKYLDVSKTTLWRYRKQGLPFYRPSPQILLFAREEVEEWIKERKGQA